MKTKYQLLRDECISLESDIINLERQLEETLNKLNKKTNHLKRLLIDCKDDFNSMTFVPRQEIDGMYDYQVINRILMREKIEYK